MNKLVRMLPAVARVFVGIVFVVFGLNGFLSFIPLPPLPESAGAFMGALGATGYMFPLIKGTEVAAGLLLLANRFVPLALLALAPVTVNIFAFHAILAPAGMAMPTLLVAAMAYLGWAYRGAFAPVLAARVSPDASRVDAAPAGRLATS